MKALAQFTNTDKGKLLAALFPEEVEKIIADIMERCTYLREHEAEVRKNWKNGFIPVMFWLDIADDAEKVIKKYRYNMLHSSKVFGEQLFYGHIALFTNDCIVKYAETAEAAPKFKLAVTLLFT